MGEQADKKPIVLAMEGMTANLVCRQAGCGICVKPGDARQIEKAIIVFYNDSFKIEELGNRGYEFIRQNFSAEKLAQNYLNLLKPIIVPKR